MQPRFPHERPAHFGPRRREAFHSDVQPLTDKKGPFAFHQAAVARDVAHTHADLAAIKPDSERFKTHRLAVIP